MLVSARIGPGPSTGGGAYPSWGIPLIMTAADPAIADLLALVRTMEASQRQPHMGITKNVEGLEYNLSLPGILAAANVKYDLYDNCTSDTV